ncbi:hypothetical protein Val02_24830 [Virgisporangium aliadipatigenens]|uniref:ABC transporter domain-containing protein n=1 Tax=Virgisporangium aliadipatigenens TaxID=741659 RepID=A0A8J4DQR3_9ACTN|nr:ATP-binding cassette domain-containing protein [Virgisporangium aliadipatigenens]GIJ45597.1 hypothetical protein Val02_24830 [Virgisporangium aliadipatigenens]
MQDWFDVFRSALLRRGVPHATVRQVVEEARAHTGDSGEPPLSAFGGPEAYADAVVASLTPTDPGRTRAPRGDVLLRARGITKRFGRRTVLRDVALDVHAGEVLAIVGANGCGKSTLLKICAGMVSPDSGTVEIAGRVGYCPQDGGTIEFLTADEHFQLVGAGRGLGRADAREHGRTWAGRLDWADPGATQARHLSGGTRQKLNLTMSALSEPDVLLLDEPYQGFDRGTYLNFWDLVWAWRDRGRAVVVVTHLLAELDKVDTVLTLGESR